MIPLIGLLIALLAFHTNGNLIVYKSIENKTIAEAKPCHLKYTIYNSGDQKLSNIHVWDQDIRKDTFTYAEPAVDFRIEALPSKSLITREFILYPQVSGEIYTAGAQYTYDRPSTDPEGPDTYKGRGTDMELKVYPYIQHRLMDKWTMHEYLWFALVYLPLAILPVGVWMLLYSKNKKVVEKEVTETKGKAKGEKKRKKK